MKKILFVLTVLATFYSCSDYETYADQKEKERNGISDFIAYHGINVIDEDVFHAQGDSTSVERNEYVYMNNSGVYMQIVRKGCGTPVQNGESVGLLVRFYEQSIFDTTRVVTNIYDPFDPDVMNISRSGTTYTATFTYGLMMSSYSTQSVPAGWLVPFSYIKVGSPRAANEQIAKVRLIVPHTQGHALATSNVYPYFYEITFQRPSGL